jgi:integrase
VPRPRKPARRGGVPGKHASPGSGSVYQDRTGRWRGSAWVTLRDGTRKRLFVSGITKEETADALELARAQHETGTSIQITQQTAAREFFVRWLDDVVRLGRPTTYETYVRAVRPALEMIGDLPLGKLRESDIQHVIAALTERGQAPATVRLTHAVLRRGLAEAVRVKALRLNVAAGAHLPVIPGREYRLLSDDELRRLLVAADAESDRLCLLWRLLATTALRRGEALGLRWRDVDVTGGRLTVSGQLVRDTSGLRRADAKTRSSRRTVVLTTPTITALGRHRERYPGGSDELVFRQANGRPWTGGSVQWFWRTFLERSGLPHVRLHDLRHGVATAMMADGIAPKAVAEMLGHSDIRVTLNTYSHVSQSLAEDAVRRFQERFEVHQAHVEPDVDARTDADGCSQA